MFDDLKPLVKYFRLPKKSTRPQIETVQHIVLQFQFGHDCCQGENEV